MSQGSLNEAQWKSFVAGVIGGGVSVLIVHPLDLAKVRLQVNERTNTVSYRGNAKGAIGTLSDIYSIRGFRGLYMGLTPNLIGASSAWGLYFYFYGKLKQYFQDYDSTVTLNTFQYLFCAYLSGFLTLTLVNPLWVVKTRLCLQYEQLNDGQTVKPTQSTWNALSRLWHREGLTGFYRGFVPGLFGISHGTIQFMLYEQMGNYYNRWYLERPANTKLSAVEYIACASSSKIVATCLTYPYQVVRSRIQDEHRKYSSVRHVIQELWRCEGWCGFYKGLLPNVVRNVPACAITFVAYEKTKSLLNQYV